MSFLEYPDTATFYEVASSGYRNEKIIQESGSVRCIVIQSTGTITNRNQELVDADAILYPDPTDAFITEHFNRLEGMFVLAALFGAADADSWYKVETVTVNRDHLLNNEIDNIEVQLKKSAPVALVS